MTCEIIIIGPKALTMSWLAKLRCCPCLCLRLRHCPYLRPRRRHCPCLCLYPHRCPCLRPRPCRCPKNVDGTNWNILNAGSRVSSSGGRCRGSNDGWHRCHVRGRTQRRSCSLGRCIRFRGRLGFSFKLAVNFFLVLRGTEDAANTTHAVKYQVMGRVRVRRPFPLEK